MTTLSDECKVLTFHIFVPAGIGVLNQDSVILGEKIRIIDKSRIIRVISHLDDDYIEQLKYLYLLFLACIIRATLKASITAHAAKLPEKLSYQIQYSK